MISCIRYSACQIITYQRLSELGLPLGCVVLFMTCAYILPSPKSSLIANRMVLANPFELACTMILEV